jgi:hypothetical protein
MNCLYEGVIPKIISNCSCLHSAVKYNVLNHSICTGRKLKCALNWMSQMGSSVDPDLTTANNTQMQPHKCLQRCDLQTETISTSCLTYPNQQTFFFRPDFCYVLQKIARICTQDIRKNIFQRRSPIKNICNLVIDMNNTLMACDSNDFPNSTVINANLQVSEFLFDYASKNLAFVKIFFRDPYYTRYIKNEQISVLSFIANAGGLLGLFLGMSFLSIFEIVYHVVNGFFAKSNECVFTNQTSKTNIIDVFEKK